MSRPSAKLCAECFPNALRAVRSAPLRGVARERGFAAQHGGSAVVVRGCRHSCDGFPAARKMSVRVQRVRGLATANERATTKEAGVEKKAYIPPTEGPLREYDTRVEEGRLRDDPYQRGRNHSRCNLGNSELTRSRNHPKPAEPLRSPESLPPAGSRPS